MTAPPDLIHYAVAEILLRLPPDDLVRAAVVCKLWHRILSDPDFRRRYRDLHRTPPLLGFLHNTYRAGYGSTPRFVPVAGDPFPLQALDDGSPWWVADCRHGHVPSSPSRTTMGNALKLLALCRVVKLIKILYQWKIAVNSTDKLSDDAEKYGDTWPLTNPSTVFCRILPAAIAIANEDTVI
ncbi:hypothetical protein EJB05_14272, partial [Eragrostis curvula]